jgi:hypothetical protein
MEDNKASGLAARNRDIGAIAGHRPDRYLTIEHGNKATDDWLHKDILPEIHRLPCIAQA